MAPSKGFIGRSTVFSVGPPGVSGGTGETFTPVAQLKTAQFGGQKINFEELTNFDSALVGITVLKEKFPATAEAGQVTLTGIFLPGDAGQQALQTAYGAGLTDFKIQLPKGPGQTTSGNLYTFSGYIAENPLPDVQFDKIVTFKCMVELTTPITLTQGT